MKILLITGWGLGTSVLKPFADLLRQQQYQVEIWDIFDPNDLSVLAARVEQAQSFDVLIGWSLGGQLALLLVHEIYQKTQLAKPVICCMSNPCFVANDLWPQAMPYMQYQQFQKSVLKNPLQAMQRFCALVTLGSSAPRERAKYLQQQILNIDLIYQARHLYLLEQLNLVNIFKSYPGKMLFVFSRNDMLVPYQLSQESELLAACNLNLVSIDAAHDAILFDTKLLINPILIFLTGTAAAKAE